MQLFDIRVSPKGVYPIRPRLYPLVPAFEEDLRQVWHVGVDRVLI
jgi:hypothetical protein